MSVYTSPVVERAKYLMALKGHPGYPELLKIAAEMVDEVEAEIAKFEGWDQAQFTILSVRLQCAKQFYEALIKRVNKAIQLGIAEMQEHPDSPSEAMADISGEPSDYVRERVLGKFAEMDSRPAGSYEPEG